MLNTGKSMVVVWALVMGWLFGLSLRAADGRQVLGRVVASSGVTLEGVPIPNEDTILAGDLLTTPRGGTALVKFSPTSQANIAEVTTVRFGYAGANPLAQISSGTMVTTTLGTEALIVETSKYRIAPAEQGKAIHVVAVLPDETTVVAARYGGVSITEISSGLRYVLPEGKYAAIPASSVGVPSQEKAGGERALAGQAGTVTNAIPDNVVQRQGQGAETALKVSDGINWADVVRTLKTGRVRIALLDGSFLNVGARSVMRIIRHDPQTQQTQVELTLGRLRAEVVKLTKPGAGFQVQTQTAIIGVVGTIPITEAFRDLTRVFCVEGVLTVRNINPAIVGQVTLHAGQFTTVARGLPPTAPVQASPAQLQSQINQTNVGPPTERAGGPGGLGGAAKAPWHIGSLSHAASIAVAATAAAGAAAAVSVPLATRGPVSPTAP